MARKPLLKLAAIAAALAIVTACSSTPENKKDDGEATEVTIYYGTPRDIMKPLMDGFKAKHPGVTVNEFRQPTEELMSTLQLELQAKNTRADVVISSAAQLYALHDSSDAFRGYETAGSANIDATLKDAEHMVHTLGVNLYLLAYNKDVISEAEAPKSFADVLDPKWKGKIAIADPNNSASIHSFIWFATQHFNDANPPFGWNYFAELGALEPRLESSHGTIRDLVLSGERPLGFLLTEHIPHLIADGEPGAWVFPSEGVPAEPLGMAAIKNAKNPAGAELFLEFVHSPEGQKIVGETMGLVPARSDMDFKFADGSTLDGIDITGVDSTYISKNRQQQADEFHKALGY